MRQNLEAVETLRQRAYRSLRSRIVRGELVPGQRLSLRKLARSLGMSIAPIGEALRELNRDGLLEMEPGWGARVRRLDAEGLRNQHILRMALECEAIRQCTATASAEEVESLAELAGDLDQSIDSVAEPEQVFELDSRFHLRIAQLSRVASLAESLRTNQLVRMLATGSRIAHRLRRPPRQHIALVKAIRSGDPEQAQRAMREHCLRSMELQLSHLVLGHLENVEEAESWTS